MRFGSLFAGIGGLDLGLERAGLTCAFQVEIDPYCRRVLAKHWPDVPRFGGIREVRGPDLPTVDLLVGGFPCTDISTAKAKARGIEGERSGLWSEYFRLVCEIRPRYVLVENSPMLLGRGFGKVLGDLAGGGYDAEWEVLPACAFGPPHTRERLFVLAYPASIGREGWRVFKPFPEALENIRRRAERLWPQRTVPSRFIRTAYGVSGRVGQLGGYGNAVLPVVAEYLGRLILAANQEIIHAPSP